MKKVGITGQGGFVGSHLYNTLGLLPEGFERIPFEDAYFQDEVALDTFVGQCDVIVHLAAVNRHESQEFLYQINLELVTKLIGALDRTGSKAHILFASSTQEERNNFYGRSKKEGRELFADWATRSGGNFTGMILPNVFGPFGRPYYNSFIATFCHQLTHGEEPKINQDGEVKLIYVHELAYQIIDKIRASKTEVICEIPHTSSYKVSEVLSKLEYFKQTYFEKGEIPVLTTSFDLNLFNSFRCYIDIKRHYPVKFEKHTDHRGVFVEIVRTEMGGQTSYSTTVPGVTRGNHFHTRKIERFAVIKGKALIQLRQVGSSEVLDFYVDGEEPAYVDMPIWYTHNIKNIGDDDLITIFWVNEAFNIENADTYYENVNQC